MNSDSKKPDGAGGANGMKKSYQAPRILSREALEVVAGPCTPGGKTNSGACPVGPILS